MQMIPVKKLIDRFGNGYYPLSVLASVINEEDITTDPSSAYKIGDLIPEKTTLNEIIKKIITGTRIELDTVEDIIDGIITEDPDRSLVIKAVKEQLAKLNYIDASKDGFIIDTVNETAGLISVSRRKLLQRDIPDLNASKIVTGTLSADRLPQISIDKLIPGEEHETIPSSLLPSYVDDVLEFETIDDFPETGEIGKIYVDLTTNLTYRWSGTQYIEISKSLALGHTSSTAFPGNEGLQNTQDIANEITRSTEKDTDLQNQIDEITGGGSGSLPALEKKIDDEITRSTQKDNDLDKKISDEITRSTNKDTDLQNQIDEITGGGSGSIQKQIQDAISKLDKPDSAVSGQVVSAVSETDGIISVSRRSLIADDIPNLTISKITNLQTILNGKENTGVAANLIKNLDVSDTAETGKVVSAVSETDGKISVTRRSLIESDIPNLNASKITSGTINSARLPYTVETWTFVPSDGSASFTKNIVIS